MLIDDLIREGFLKTGEVATAFRAIKRADFLRPENRYLAEEDNPLPIGHGQTISQPATVAYMLELLKVEKGQKVLDVGSGSGWTTALLARMVGDEGHVYAIELDGDLQKFGEDNVRRYGFIPKTATMLQGDGWEGLPQYAPFDRILVSAAAARIPPKLVEQLADGGRMVVPVGQPLQTQSIVLVKKSIEGEVETREHFGFVFVPLKQA